MSPEEIITGALDRYERPLISYAKEITGDLESARDAVQETFLRLSRQDVAKLEPRLRPWLFLVCRNCALDHRRKILKFSADPIEDNDQASDDPAPDIRVIANEEGNRLRELVAGLPLQQRELVKLKFEAGLSYREMAEALKTSVSTVGVQLHEAMLTLRRQWNRGTTETAAS
ncbi:MAG: sigma-70 family RNA polymerase sigma factor [Chthoniobacterales bacterium]|nr:sigma-70 family RNA polymerase sigma factor [Chthoniobacterales bacterium]